MNYEDVKEEFVFDGAWLDIYVLGVTLDDWQKMLDFLRDAPYTTVFLIDGEENEIPRCLGKFDEEQTIYGLRSGMAVDLGDVILKCHFFSEDEIEFDFDPGEVNNQLTLVRMFDFVRALATLLQKQVVITPENLQMRPIFRAFPNNNSIQHIRY